MKSLESVLQHINTFHELGEAIQAVEFTLKEFGLEHPNLKGFELRERTKNNLIVLTTEGEFGQSQIIRIPENAFEFEFILMLNLLAHEMVHVRQKTARSLVLDKNEREWQAYYEMLFHIIFPQIPDSSDFQRKQFAKKGLEYFNRMENNGALQQKYAAQKEEVEQLLQSLK